MSWQEEYSQHPVWEVAKDVNFALLRLGWSEGVEVEPPAFSQARAMISAFIRLRNAPDPFVDPGYLDEILDLLVRLQGEMIPSGSWWEESMRRGVLNDLARALRTMPSTARGRLKGITERADEVERSLGDGLVKMREMVDRLRERQEARLEEIEKENSAHRATLDTELAVADQRLVGLNDAIQSANQTVQEQAGRLDRLLSDQHSAFEQEREKRGTIWEQELEKFLGGVEAHDQAMEEQREKSKRVLEAIGVEATASGYGTYARDQGRVANRWRIIAVIVFGIAIAWFILSPLFLWHPTGPTVGAQDWWSFLPKWGGTALAAGAGAWASRESGLHRKEERKAKQIQLALAALEPFVANMQAEHQEDLRVETARSIFVKGRELEARDAGRAATATESELNGAATHLVTILTEALKHPSK